MGSFVDLKMFGAYTLININTVFPLLNGQHTEFLGC